jgi:hypothetical protein
MATLTPGGALLTSPALVVADPSIVATSDRGHDLTSKPASVVLRAKVSVPVITGPTVGQIWPLDKGDLTQPNGTP